MSSPGGCGCTGAASTAEPRPGRASPSSSTASGRAPGISARSPNVAELAFDCVGAHPEKYAVTPSMSLKLRIAETSGQKVEAIALRCQIRIEPTRRRYSDVEAQRLNALFGDTQRSADTLKPLQFTNVSVMVPAFTGSTEVELPVMLSYDLEIGSPRDLAC